MKYVSLQMFDTILVQIIETGANFHNQAGVPLLGEGFSKDVEQNKVQQV